MLTFFSLIALTSAAVIPANITAIDADATFSAPASTAISPSLPSNGQYQFPHLIIPVDRNDSENAPGTQYTAEISTTKTTIFQFDIPCTPEYTGKVCDLVFMFPYKDDIKAVEKYEWSGLEAQEYSHGGISFALLSEEVNQATTYANMPKATVVFPLQQLKPGSSNYFGSGPCDSSHRLAISATGVGIFYLKMFQSQEVGAPQGLFLIPRH
ncbi:ubiquitin 3 binding protein But2 C-terminal domain-containing protein [Calycina marina]|uniref:Ubiquitin 3 binding protein But2 C-terminal domain-containing protein n=1 Tax=Calycina marina TaxID=1763456 RepID=A0A9P7YV52_9HELO|nr:ubiquitin 3 binding protein But2 C-terminal domain-containing protein [Calycina marina]